ncbi:MAG: hypothetical protein ACTTI6_07280 [Treponema sp.]|uniref:hypothetical protein n=1 Tax=Treponema sp. TaxID=166 RepID=UPI003FA2C3CD
MKRSKIVLLMMIVSFLFFACKTVPKKSGMQAENIERGKTASSGVVDNTFTAMVVNNSRFIISLDGKTIAPTNTAENAFPLHDSELYDGWFVNYTIPLTSSVFYEYKDKIQITDKQQTVRINNPENKTLPETYIIVKNVSQKSIQLTNGLGTIFACCLDGHINSRETKLEHNTAPGKTAVYEIIKPQKGLLAVKVYVSIGRKNYPLMDNTFLQQGIVYTYIFDGTQIVKEDERPLLKINEPLWNRNSADGVSIAKIISAPGKDFFYAVGKVRKKDTNGSLYEAGFIQCTERNGTERWTHFFEETGCDSAVYDGIVLDNGDLLAAGHTSGDVQSGLLLLYSSDGGLLNTQKIEESSGFESVIPFTDGTFLLTGFDGENKLIFGKVHIEKSVIRYESFPVILPLTETEFITRAIPLYDSRTKTLFVCCNLRDAETELPMSSALFAITDDGTANRISLKHVIKSVATVRQDANGMLYIGGETGAVEHSAAMIVTVDIAQNKQAAFYTGGTPYAYIADMLLNEKSGELIIAGTEKAADNFGNGGVPFFKSLAISSGKELWTAGYSDKTYELLSSFIPCTDYGFIAQFTAVNEDGEYSPPLCIVRLSATGKMGK